MCACSASISGRSLSGHSSGALAVAKGANAVASILQISHELFETMQLRWVSHRMGTVMRVVPRGSDAW